MSSQAPAGWIRTDLGSITNEEGDRVGSAPPPVVLSSTKHHGLVPSGEFFKGRTIYSADLSNYKSVHRDWFAYATNHLAEGSVGLQARFATACVSPIYTVFSCRDSVDPSFLFRVLKVPATIAAFQIYEQASVDRRGAVRYRDFAKVSIDLPPRSEQRRIAEILDTVDDAIRSTENIIAKLGLMKLGLLHDLLTRGTDEGGTLRASSGSEDGFVDTQLGRLPAGWLVDRLGAHLIAIEAGHSPDVPDRPASPGEWGVLKVSAVRPDGFQSNENKAVTERALIDPKDEVHNGDVLITRANTPQLVGLACVVTGGPQRLLLSDKTLRLIVNGATAYPEYACLLLQSPIARAQIEVNGTGSSGSMKNISQQEIRDLLLPWPSLAEQRRICERSHAIADRIAEGAIGLGKLRQLKQGLIEDLLTGRVRTAVDDKDAA